jgi:hypothetical protein
MIYAGHIAHRAINHHLSVPSILIKQYILGAYAGESNFFASVVALDKKSLWHTNVFRRQLQDLAVLVIFTEF